MEDVIMFFKFIFVKIFANKLYKLTNDVIRKVL